MIRIDISAGIDDWFYWIPTIKSCHNGKYISIEFLLLWWYLDISFAIVNYE